MGLEKKSIVKVVHFFRYFSEKINFEMINRHVENAHFQTEFLVKISKKKNSSNRVNLSLGMFLISSAQS